MGQGYRRRKSHYPGGALDGMGRPHQRLNPFRSLIRFHTHQTRLKEARVILQFGPEKLQHHRVYLVHA